MIPIPKVPKARAVLDHVRNKPCCGPDLELMKRPCHDCAVECGFYKEYSDAYKEMGEEEKLSRSKKWFCHNAPNRACRGHADNIGVEW